MPTTVFTPDWNSPGTPFRQTWQDIGNIDRVTAAPVETELVRIVPSSGPHRIRLFRLGAEENNIIATWQKQGSPAYPSPAQISELRTLNVLRSTPSHELSTESSGNNLVVSFTLERPGVALLETY